MQTIVPLEFIALEIRVSVLLKELGTLNADYIHKYCNNLLTIEGLRFYAFFYTHCHY